MEPITMNIPVLALRGLTVFPHMNLTFDVERRVSIAALERAMEADQDIFLVTQREVGVDVPGEGDLYEIGTVSHIRQILRLSPHAVRCVVEGRQRARLRRLWQAEPYLQANVELIEESASVRRGPRMEALLRQAGNLFGEYAGLVNSLPEEVVAQVMDCQDPGYLADFIAQNINLRYTDKQEILEELVPYVRLRKLNGFLARECDVLGFEHEMEGKVRDQLIRTQRDQILRTQIRVLQNELGEEDEDDEIEVYRQKILELQLEEDTEKHLMKEVSKLAKQPYSSAEAAVIRNYLDVCLEMPWNVTTRERVSVDAARKVLERDHYGLEKVKERILETIAVRQMNPESKGQIICLVGPPGVGKTSIAISVAKALNRKLARLSLGGVRDEADIRGHRKTYIGSMPGRIIEAISRSGSMNPLLLLDEIDKLGSDYRGDPAAALLEVLDSEQNYAFRDHFLEIPVDLRKVMFITTANTTDTIPRPLLDRMEVIQLSS
ncbi:LON peptidase substrate-binding domain-containing protein, partial [uncultured Oscillibacter sp.]